MEIIGLRWNVPALDGGCGMSDKVATLYGKNMKVLTVFGLNCKCEYVPLEELGNQLTHFTRRTPLPLSFFHIPLGHFFPFTNRSHPEKTFS
jgi:hypothetical protein